MRHLKTVIADNSSTMKPAVERRDFLKQVGAAIALGGMSTASVTAQTTTGAGPYQLPPLGYAFDALEPFIDAQTMEIHHDKHHQSYVNNLNKTLNGSGVPKQPIDQLIANLDQVPENIRTAVRNNGGGHANHTLFWEILKKDAGKPSQELSAAIDEELGGHEKFKSDFTQAATTRFGSGWAWLSLDKNKKLVVESTANQDSPVMTGNVPLLGIDVWEHAYYLKYQNRRPDYVAAFFSVINWPKVNELYAAGIKA